MSTNKINPADLRKVAYDTALPMSVRQEAHAKYNAWLDEQAQQAYATMPEWIESMKVKGTAPVDDTDGTTLT